MSNTSMNTEYGLHRDGAGVLHNLREFINETSVGITPPLLPIYTDVKFDSILDMEGYAALEGYVGYLSLGMRSGHFKFDSSNLSAQVSSDPLQGIYVAPSSDPTGASGAWVRVITDGKVNPYMFGAGSTANLNRLALQAAIDSGYQAEMVKVQDETDYIINGTVTVTDGKSLTYNGHFEEVVVKSTNKADPIFIVSGKVTFGGFSIEHDQSLTVADTGAICLGLRGVRNSIFLPMAIRNGYDLVKLLQQDGELDPPGISTEFQNVWHYLFLRRAYHRHLELSTYGNSESTDSIFLNIRIQNIAEDQVNLIPIEDSIYFGKHSGNSIGIINIEDCEFTSSAISVIGAGANLDITHLHCERVTFSGGDCQFLRNGVRRINLGSFNCYTATVENGCTLNITSVTENSSTKIGSFTERSTTLNGSGAFQAIRYTGVNPSQSSYLHVDSLHRFTGSVITSDVTTPVPTQGFLLRRFGDESSPVRDYTGDGIGVLIFGDADFQATLERTPRVVKVIPNTFTANRTITLPAASAVPDGLTYQIHNEDGTFILNVVEDGGGTIRNLSPGEGFIYKALTSSWIFV